MTFLLCDVLQNATFGKINIKNLNKIKKLPLKGKDFIRNSGGQRFLPDDAMLSDIAIHDQISHKKVPQSIKKYLPFADDIKFDAKRSKKSYLPLIDQNNQTKKGLSDYDYNTQNKIANNNSFIESVVAGVEGRQRRKKESSKGTIIGNALRKRYLTPEEKIATRFRGSSVIDNLTRRSARQSDIDELLLTTKRLDRDKPARIAPKIKGTKPVPTTIEEKKQRLGQKYGIQR